MKEKIYSVYKITCLVNNKIYVGQTWKPLRSRLLEHFSHARSNVRTKFYSAIRKYGEENFKIELIETCESQDELDRREYYWICKLDAVNSGYNTKDTIGKTGGDTLSNHPNIKEISKKIAKSKIGGKNPQSTKIKAKHIESGIELFFDSVSDAQKYFGITHHTTICRRCNHKLKTLINGWTFAYVSNDYCYINENATQGIIGIGPVKVKVIDIKTNEMYFYESIAEAIKSNKDWSDSGFKNAMKNNRLYKERFKIIRC